MRLVTPDANPLKRKSFADAGRTLLDLEKGQLAGWPFLFAHGSRINALSDDVVQRIAETIDGPPIGAKNVRDALVELAAAALLTVDAIDASTGCRHGMLINHTA